MTSCPKVRVQRTCGTWTINFFTLTLNITSTLTLTPTFTLTHSPSSPSLSPKGPSWFDEAISPTQAHQPAECSNMGICDKTEGTCACRKGFTGRACEKYDCVRNQATGVCYYIFIIHYLLFVICILLHFLCILLFQW